MNKQKLREAIEAMFKEVKDEIHKLKDELTELSIKVDKLKSTKSEFEGLKHEMRNELKELRDEVYDLRNIIKDLKSEFGWELNRLILYTIDESRIRQKIRRYKEVWISDPRGYNSLRRIKSRHY